MAGQAIREEIMTLYQNVYKHLLDNTASTKDLAELFNVKETAIRDSFQRLRKFDAIRRGAQAQKQGDRLRYQYYAVRSDDLDYHMDNKYNRNKKYRRKRIPPELKLTREKANELYLPMCYASKFGPMPLDSFRPALNGKIYHIAYPDGWKYKPVNT